MQRAGKDVGLTDFNEVQQKFNSMISVQVPSETSLLLLSATSANQKQAATLANAACKAFVEWKKEIAQSSVREMMEKLDDIERKRTGTQKIISDHKTPNEEAAENNGSTHTIRKDLLPHLHNN